MFPTKTLLCLFFSLITFCANAQWVSKSLNNQNCFGVDFYDENTGIVFFQDGKGFLTNDKGKTWSAAGAVPEIAYNGVYKDIKFLSRTKIMTCGGTNQPTMGFGSDLISYNQGTSWELSSQQGHCTALHSRDSNKVHVVGYEGNYWWYNVKNKTWNRRTNLNTIKDFYGVQFVDSSTGYICGDAGLLLKTNNAGGNWTIQNTGSSSVLYSMYFISKNIGWAVGGDQTTLVTINGGVTWKRTSYLGGGTTYRSVKFVSPKIGYVCGDFGTILKTTDGGNTWKAMQTGTYETLNQMAFPDSLNGWAVGTNGTILYLNEDKKVPKVQTVIPSDTFMCTAGTYSVAFAVNKKFNTGNIFTAQLSDGQGNWANPQTLGTLASDTSGSISFTLGKNQVLDGGYRIRIVSSAPAQTSVQTQSPLSVDVGTPASVSIGNVSVECEGQAVTLNAQYANGGFEPVFQWYINGNATSNTGTSISSTTLKKGDKVSFQMTSSADCPVPKRPIATINAPVAPTPAKPVISLQGNTLVSNASTGNQWEQDGSPISGATNSQYTPTTSGSYRVKVKDGNCESDYSDGFPFFVTATEANSLENISTAIYPVPCTNELHFQTNISVQTIFLKDLTGRILLQESGASQNAGTLEIATIPAGIYYLELLGSNGKQERKTFLKQ